MLESKVELNALVKKKENLEVYGFTSKCKTICQDWLINNIIKLRVSIIETYSPIVKVTTFKTVIALTYINN